MYFWLVAHRDKKVILNTIRPDREEVKLRALKWLGGNRDEYIVEPIATPLDQIHFEITVGV